MIHPKTKLNIGIVDFFESDFVLGIKNLSPIQKITLKAIRGESLDSQNSIPTSHSYQDKEFVNEIEMFKHFSGKSEYFPNLYSDASLCFGRRSGKSTTLGAGLAIFYATQFDYKPYLGTSPHATIPIISHTKDQAGEVYAAIKGFFLRSAYLFNTFLSGDVRQIQDEYNEEDLENPSVLSGGQIKLNNKVVIKVMAADISKIRGMAVPFAILDEVCFFGTEGNDTKNTDQSIYEALSPSSSQFQSVEGMALILKISSPNGQSGLMYEEYLNSRDSDILHLKVPSWYANPTISEKYLEKQKKKGMGYFSREYGAEYTASEMSYLDPTLVDACIIKNIEKIPPIPGYRYVAAMDYATKGDYWGFGIGHKEYTMEEGSVKKETVFVDYVCKWRGTSGSELDPSEIIPLICEQMKRYGVTYCISDQYAFAALRPLFRKEGCTLKEFKVTYQSKTKYMYSLQISVNSGNLKIVDDLLAVRHLKDLREKRTGAGKVRIEHASNCHDDLADVIGLIAYQFDKTSPIFVGMHKVSEDEVESTKDAMGKFIRMPTASDLASTVGVLGFYDNREDHEAKQEDPEDQGNFWFSL